MARATGIWCAVSLVLMIGTAAWAADDILIADFEGSNYGDWTVSGVAFGPGPAKGTLAGQMRVSGHRGKGLVNSFFKGDGSTGTLTSPEFTILRPHINFLIGGGKHPGETCMNLLVEDKVVRTATGPNDQPGGSEQLSWQSWDVSGLAGKRARIQIVDQHTGGWGHINVDHIHQSERSLVLPDLERTMRIEKRFLKFPVKSGAEMRLMKVGVNGESVREFMIELADDEADFWAFLDVESLRGDDVTLQTEQTPESNPEALKKIVQSDIPVEDDNLYKEKLRPKFHFSSRRGWLNDPNGLVYHEGEYHLFYQHNPYGVRWGNMHWGHAVSTDLVHWKELGDALYPDKQGTMFSGSAVVDVDNTAGFQTGAEKPIVCIYTAAGGTSPESKGQPFTQGVAYSNDRGRTWTKYEGNPVLGHIDGSNRDPKVIWHEPTKQWVMALYLDKHDYVLYASPNLTEWTKLCDLEIPEASECPDFFELPVDGDPERKVWLYWAANGTYALGTFDAKTFSPTEGIHNFDHGGMSYAAQTFSDIPPEDGRRIQICWGRFNLPGMPFNQFMTFPCELTLRTTKDGVRLFAEPVKEIESIRKTKHEWRDEIVKPDSNLLDGLEGDAFDIEAEFDVGKAKTITFIIRGVPVVYDVKRSELKCKDKTAPLKTEDGTLHLRLLVDRASIEIFGGHGRVYLPMGAAFDEEEKALTLSVKGGKATVKSLAAFELGSAWE